MQLYRRNLVYLLVYTSEFKCKSHNSHNISTSSSQHLLLLLRLHLRAVLWTALVRSDAAHHRQRRRSRSASLVFLNVRVAVALVVAVATPVRGAALEGGVALCFCFFANTTEGTRQGAVLLLAGLEENENRNEMLN